MIDPENVPPVDADELLARYVTHKSQYRPSDGTVRQNLFIPPPDLELSVTRHRDVTENEVWQVGHDVARELKRALIGRADIQSRACELESLHVEADPLPENPNHAHIVGWPEQKDERKAIASELAASAGKMIPLPTGPS